MRAPMWKRLAYALCTDRLQFSFHAHTILLVCVCVSHRLFIWYLEYTGCRCTHCAPAKMLRCELSWRHYVNLQRTAPSAQHRPARSFIIIHNNNSMLRSRTIVRKRDVTCIKYHVHFAKSSFMCTCVCARELCCAGCGVGLGMSGCGGSVFKRPRANEKYISVICLMCCAFATKCSVLQGSGVLHCTYSHHISYHESSFIVIRSSKWCWKRCRYNGATKFTFKSANAFVVLWFAFLNKGIHIIGVSRFFSLVRLPKSEWWR